MPRDISHRISQFIAGKIDFPYVNGDEIMAAFYLCGKEHGVQESEVSEVQDMAKKSVEQVARDVRLYTLNPTKKDPEFTRENYTKRSLQIAVDSSASDDIAARVAGDPAILSDCYAQHIAHHKQAYYFELFGPFKAEQLPIALRGSLEGRMLLLGFNAKDRGSLPFRNAADPFFEWMITTKKKK